MKRSSYFLSFSYILASSLILYSSTVFADLDRKEFDNFDEMRSPKKEEVFSFFLPDLETSILNENVPIILAKTDCGNGKPPKRGPQGEEGPTTSPKMR